MSFRFDNLERLSKQGITVSLPTDSDGYFGRECPAEECLGVFRVRLGTGLPGDLPCHCPYCGQKESHDHFYTQEQIKYVESVQMRQVSDAFSKDLKKLEFEHKPGPGSISLGMSLKLGPSRPIPLHRIQEPYLETQVTCTHCSLDYAVFGLFAFCPDCGARNSRQILNRNLALILRQLNLARTVDDTALANRLIEGALESCVSAFDGFGRELIRLHAERSSDPSKCGKVSFQNLDHASDIVIKLFDFDLREGVSHEDWRLLQIGFMRRHLLAHRSGVIDDKYIAETGEDENLVGRRLGVEESSVRELVAAVSSLGSKLEELFAESPDA